MNKNSIAFVMLVMVGLAFGVHFCRADDSAATTTDAPGRAAVVLFGQKKHGIENYTILPAKVKAVIEEKKWNSRPWRTLFGSVVAAGGSIALMQWINAVLRKDKRARELKLKKEQHVMGGANPMLHMMRMLEMQQKNGDESDDQTKATMPLPEDEQHAVVAQEEALQWNQKHILKPGVRKGLGVLLFFLRITSLAMVIKVLDSGRDFWHGNCVPMALKQEINQFNGALRELGGQSLKIKNNPDALATMAYLFKSDRGLEKYLDQSKIEGQSQSESYVSALKGASEQRLVAAVNKAAETERKSLPALHRLRQAAFGYDL